VLEIKVVRLQWLKMIMLARTIVFVTIRTLIMVTSVNVRTVMKETRIIQMAAKVI
jgi:hypothetical protein